MGDYQKIFKAYDIRGIVPDELDEQVAESVGAAFARLTGARSVVTVHDMRTSSGPLAEAFGRGAAARARTSSRAASAPPTCSTTPAARSACPARWSPPATTRPSTTASSCAARGARPVGADTGLAELRDMAAAGVPASGGPPGTITRRDLLSGYADHLKTLVNLAGIRPLTVAVDAGNGMAGHTVPKVFEGLPITLVPLYFELDGTFPNHEANPIDPENLRDLQRAVLDSGADIGLAFDGDADRCFVVDERGHIVSPSVLTALIAVRELAREPGGTVIHNLITSQAVPEIIAEHGGTPVRTRVGHSFIKARMAETNAVFGGEHSGHFYFRDFWFADSGMLAALHVLAALGGQDGPLSRLLAGYARYVASGEINSEVADQAAGDRAGPGGVRSPPRDQRRRAGRADHHR